ncbi:MAG: hypothetical protein LBI13_09195 [Streptococcaceae bacterium]|nr:hypothetical protein [Streptococcaceae bacterium]
MPFRATAESSLHGNYTIPMRCSHCQADNYISDRNNFWKCWHCDWEL